MYDDREADRRGAVAIGALAASVASVFAFSAPGLIDDDAYIFLRYAENLARGNGLSFNPGEPSAGITGPLWVLLLAIAHRFTGVDLLLLARVLGAACFGIATGVLTRVAAAEGASPATARLGGAIVALSPVFVCQAVSGMEVGLNMALTASAILWLRHQLVLSSLAAGLAFLTRPDNLLLAPVLVLGRKRNRLRAAVWIGALSLLLGLPWLAYCHQVAGSLLPPTRTGKLLVFLPAWYGITVDQLSASGLAERAALAVRVIGRVAWLLAEGQARALLLWLPLLPFGLMLVKGRLRLPLALLCLLALAYALFFPLVKLRYFVHLLPWMIPVALAVGRRSSASRLRASLYGLLLLLHVALTVRALPRYRSWVACEGTKTRAGQWLAEHTPLDARVALEPIGAIGYHGRRYVIDLGGLIDTGVWPVIRRGPWFDEAEMLAYLGERDADYLIDQVDGPWAGRLLRALPDSLRLEATIHGREGCGAIGVYAISDESDTLGYGPKYERNSRASELAGSACKTRS